MLFNGIYAEPIPPVVEVTRLTGAVHNYVEKTDVTVPAGIQAGDLLIAVARSGSMSNTARAQTTPSGWTKIAAAEHEHRAIQLVIKVAIGNESGQTLALVNKMSSSGNAMCIALRGTKPIASLGAIQDAIAWVGNNNPPPQTIRPTIHGVKPFILLAFAAGKNPSQLTANYYSGATPDNKIQSTTGNYIAELSYKFYSAATVNTADVVIDVPDMGSTGVVMGLVGLNY